MKNKIDTMIDSYIRYKTNLHMYYKILSKRKVLIFLAEEVAVTDTDIHSVISAAELHKIYKEELFDVAFDYSKEEIEKIISKRVGNIVVFRLENLLKMSLLSTEGIKLVDSDMRALYRF